MTTVKVDQTVAAAAIVSAFAVGAAAIPAWNFAKKTIQGCFKKKRAPPTFQKSWSGTAAELEVFFEDNTSTLTYVLYDKSTLDAVVIDPVLDFDLLGWQTSTKFIEKVAEFIKSKKLKLQYVLETHVHADHLTGAAWLKKTFSCKSAIGDRVCGVQKLFRDLFDLDPMTPIDGSQFDKLIKDGETFHVGSLEIKALATPGHTPACMSYIIGNFVFTGDVLFLEDCGSGRCDFPAGSAEALYHSIHERLYTLPDGLIVCPGHDYPGDKGRSWDYRTTIGSSKANNVSIKYGAIKEEFVKWRNARDSKLANPRLIFQSVQVNLNNGKLPTPHKNGIRYLTMPLNLKSPTDDAGFKQ